MKETDRNREPDKQRGAVSRERDKGEERRRWGKRPASIEGDTETLI